MRFAMKIAPMHTNWADMLAVFRAADEIEIFESGWNFDHFYPIRGDHTGPCLEGWLTLAALAQATNRIRLGVLVTGIHYRHPAVLANMAASADIIAQGRLELGLGAGWFDLESDAYGIELGTPKERSDRFEEACEVIVRLLSQETTDFEGRYYRLREARCEPKPVQQPHPPICIGGGGEKRTLRTTAKWAQHWNFVGGPPEEFRRKKEILAEHCSAVGRDLSEITLSTHVPLDPANPEATAEAAAALQEAGAQLAIIQLPPPHSPAVLEPLAKALGEVPAH